MNNNSKCKRKSIKFNKNIFLRFAFTLAEVLITLGIIGVVASMTIPVLMKNVQDKQNKEAFKKIYADLSAATLMIKQENGGTLTGAFYGHLEGHLDHGDFEAQYAKYLKVLKGGQHYSGSCSYANNGECWAANTYWLNGSAVNTWPENRLITISTGLLLTNGTYVVFPAWYYFPECDHFYYGATVSFCALMYVDVNGNKKPNTYGKDIYKLAITSEGLLPYGIPVSNIRDDDCSRTAGRPSNTCASYVMKGADY